MDIDESDDEAEQVDVIDEGNDLPMDIDESENESTQEDAIDEEVTKEGKDLPMDIDESENESTQEDAIDEEVTKEGKGDCTKPVEFQPCEASVALVDQKEATSSSEGDYTKPVECQPCEPSEAFVDQKEAISSSEGDYTKPVECQPCEPSEAFVDQKEATSSSGGEHSKPDVCQPCEPSKVLSDQIHAPSSSGAQLERTKQKANLQLFKEDVALIMQDDSEDKLPEKGCEMKDATDDQLLDDDDHQPDEGCEMKDVTDDQDDDDHLPEDGCGITVLIVDQDDDDHLPADGSEMKDFTDDQDDLKDQLPREGFWENQMEDLKDDEEYGKMRRMAAAIEMVPETDSDDDNAFLSECEDDVEDPQYNPSDEDESLPLEDLINQITQEIHSLSERPANFPTSSSDEIPASDDSDLRKPCQRRLSEIDMLRDSVFPEIYVKKYNPSGRKTLIKMDSRPYDTVHACKFCSKLFTHIQDHLENKHKNRPEVSRILELKRKLKELPNQSMQTDVKICQSLLRFEGDHIHNVRVVNNNEGELLVQRKACGKERFNHHNYGPCPKCHLWLDINRSLQAHQKNCKINDHSLMFGRGKKAITVALSKAKIAVGQDNIDTSCPLVKKYIFPIMRNDEVSALAKEDDLIAELGEIWMVKSYGNKLVRNKTSSFRMRLAARLLIAIRKLYGKPHQTIRNILSPEHFDAIVRVALELCEVDEHDMLKHPSVALKIGYDLGRLAGLKLCISIKNHDEDGETSAKQFLKLLKLQWCSKVSKFAHLAVTGKHSDNHRELPHPSDIATVAECLVGLAKKIDLSEIGHYQRAVQVALPCLMVYNRRRIGEIEALRLERYKKRTKKVDDVDRSLLGELTILEKFLLESQELVWIRGKQGKRVPVLIPPDIRDSLVYIADSKVREAAGVKLDSPYLFANTGHGVYSAIQCLRDCCTGSNLIHPDRLTSTGFRAYMATIAQCSGLKDHEVQRMCAHLGHTLDVHQTHYRHTMEGIERIQLGKLLMVQDRNLVQDYRAKGLEEIQFEDIVGQIDDGINKQEPTPEDEEYTFCDVDPVIDSEVGKKSKKSTPRQKWSAEEEKELRVLFKKNFENLKCPNTKEIKHAMQNSEKNQGLVQFRKLDNIKKKVSNMLINIKKQKE